MMLQKLEDATLPLQNFLDVPISQDKKDREIVADLPTGFQPIYEKLKVFAGTYEYKQYNLKVSLHGDQSQSLDAYEKYNTQLIFNSRLSKSSQSKPEKSQQPNSAGILNRSKAIKKKPKKSKVITEEGEEGA